MGFADDDLRPPPGHRFFYYLESDDGLTWKRPNPGIFDFQGSRANNILRPKLPRANIFIDPSAPSGERYKLVQMGIERGVSPDGLHWTILPEPIVDDYSDTQQVGYYDVCLWKYVIYSRRWSVGPRSPRLLQDGRRSWSKGRSPFHRRTEGEDFRKLPVPETILEPGPDLLPSNGLYTNCRTSIPGAPDRHLMFPKIWYMSSDTSSVAMTSSHDGKLWHYVPGPPVLTTGPFGAWDGGCVLHIRTCWNCPTGASCCPIRVTIFLTSIRGGDSSLPQATRSGPKGDRSRLKRPGKGSLRLSVFSRQAGSWA